MEILEGLAEGGPEQAEDEDDDDEDELEVERFSEKKLKEKIADLVTGFDWVNWLDIQRVHALMESIDYLEGLRRRLRTEAWEKRKRNRENLRA